MKLTFNHWTLIIEQLEKVANDEQESAAKRLEAIEALKILKEQKIGWLARREQSRQAIKINKTTDWNLYNLTIDIIKYIGYT